MNTNCIATYRSMAAARGTKARALYLGLCALVMTVAANAGEPRIITFDAPGAGATTGSFQGTGCYSDCSVLINNFGAITGTYEDANSVFHGFVRSPQGKFTTFDSPGADTTAGDFNGTFPNGINDAGAITGYYMDASGGDHGFLRSPEGTFTTFEVPGANTKAGDFLGTFPVSINDQGVITGYYVDKNNVLHGFLMLP